MFFRSVLINSEGEPEKYYNCNMICIYFFLQKYVSASFDLKVKKHMYVTFVQEGFSQDLNSPFPESFRLGSILRGGGRSPLKRLRGQTLFSILYICSCLYIKSLYDIVLVFGSTLYSKCFYYKTCHNFQSPFLFMVIFILC